MALTRAQLLMGNNSDGIVLSGQPQGVRPGGAGITILADGTITVNSQSVVGLMKLGQTPTTAGNAYNGYTWPISDGAAGTQLQTDGAGNLSWADPDGIPWTAKGQLVVGQPAGAQVILNAGTNTSFLMADATTASGLIYSNSVTSASQMPAGDTTARPNPASPGQLRYNTLTNKFEFATGATTWEEIASGVPTVNGFVKQTIPTTGSPSAVIPSGTTAQRQTSPAPLAGYQRFNISTSLMEVFDGLAWVSVGAPPTAGLGITSPVALSKLPFQPLPFPQP